jgi:hypothetical protein
MFTASVLTPSCAYAFTLAAGLPVNSTPLFDVLVTFMLFHTAAQAGPYSQVPGVV